MTARSESMNFALDQATHSDGLSTIALPDISAGINGLTMF